MEVVLVLLTRKCWSFMMFFTGLKAPHLPPFPGVCDRIVGIAGRLHCIFHVLGRMPPLLDQARVAVHSKTRMAYLCKWQLNLLTQTSCAPLSKVTKNGCVFLLARPIILMEVKRILNGVGFQTLVKHGLNSIRLMNVLNVWAVKFHATCMLQLL